MTATCVLLVSPPLQFGGDFRECNPTRPIPVIAIQGTLDVLVPHLGNPLLNFPSFAQDLVDMQVQ